MPQDATPAPNNGQPRSRSVFDAEVDRSRAFRRARRHTLWVRTLRYALPMSAVAMLAGYGFLMQRSISFSWGDKRIEAERITITRQALVAHEPRYSGFDKQGGEFEVRATTAEQDLKQKGFVRLKGIQGWIRDQSRTKTDLKATRGTLDTNTSILELYERIDVVSQNGMSADLTRATIHTKESRIVSDEPVLVRMPSGTVRGNTMTIEQKRKVVLFAGDVTAHLKPQARAADAQRAADPSMRDTQGQSGLGRNDQPVDVTSRRLLIDDAARLATFSGAVVARQGEAQLETEELEVAYEGQAAAAGGQRPPTGPGETSRLRRLLARSSVILTRGNEKATGSSGEFDAIADRATLMGPVVISAGADRGATADRAELDNKADTILLIGNVVVTQQRNVVKGRRLMADRKAGTVQVSSPANAGMPKGQISARLYQADSDNGTARKPSPAPAAKAPASAAGAPGGPMSLNMRGDPSQPIDIDADTLDVDDRKKTAVFRGRVRALQGQYTINTEELMATYSGDAGLALAAAPPGAQAAAAPAAGQPKSGAQLQKVVSPRVVEIVAKDGQRARGNSAVFDPKANTATLSGDVRLVQGTTITTGSCALLDMNTGLMRVIDACGFSSGAPPKSATARAIAPGRAQVLLYPGQLKEERQQEKAKATGGQTRSTPAAGGSAQAPLAPPAASPAPRRPPGRVEESPGIFGQ